MLWVDGTHHALQLGVLVILVKTYLHFFVATVVDRSSVPPNHNSFFRLSRSLGTYSNKWWLTHTHRHTNTDSDSLDSLGWGCFEVTWHKAIILTQSWVNHWTFTSTVTPGGMFFEKLQIKGVWRKVQLVHAGVWLCAVESCFDALFQTTSSSVSLRQKNMAFEWFDNDSLAICLYCVGQTSMKSELLTNFPPREKTC